MNATEVIFWLQLHSELHLHQEQAHIHLMHAKLASEMCCILMKRHVCVKIFASEEFVQGMGQ